jgi:hypothetical protein
LLVLFHEMITSGLSLYPSDPADPRYSEFVFEHSWRWLRGETSSLFDLPMGWPLTNTLALTEPLLSFTPFYWPFRAVGLSPSSSYQLWTVTVAALNFGCFYALMRRTLLPDRIAASSAAYLFAFGLPRVAQIGHSQLWPQVYLVLVLWGLHALLASSLPMSTRRWGAPAVVVGGVLQAWGCLYNAVFLAYVCFVTGIFTLLQPEWRKRALHAVRGTTPAGGACIAIALACAWPLVQAYLAVPESTQAWNEIEVRMLQPRLGSMLYVWQWSWFYGWMTTATSLGQLPALHEQALGLGLLTTCVVLVTLVRLRRLPALQLTGVLVAVLWLPALVWPGDLTLWGLLHAKLPGLSALRATSRMGLLLMIPASVALGICVQRRSESRWPTAWLALVALCLIEQGTNLLSFPKQPFERGVERVAQQVDRNADAFLYIGSGRVPPWFTNVDALLAAQRAGIPTVNLYTSRIPKGYEPMIKKTARTPAERRRIERNLDAWIRSNGRDPERVQRIYENELPTE